MYAGYRCQQITIRLTCTSSDLHCNPYNKFNLYRRPYSPDGGATCRGGVDSGGQGMAAEEPGSHPNSLVEAHQPRRWHTTLSGDSKQGETSEDRDILQLVTSGCSYSTSVISHSPSSLQQGSMWSYCMNEEVLKLGLARTAPIVGVLPNSRLYWSLHKRLHRAEVRAERKGRGLWKEDSLWERASKAVKDSALFRLMRRLFNRTWCSGWLCSRTKKTSEVIRTWQHAICFNNGV